MSTLGFPPPEHWQDFESLTLDVAKLEYPGAHVQKYAREGQEQHGVDILVEHGGAEIVGIQCKQHRLVRKKAGLRPNAVLSIARLQSMLTATEGFRFRLQQFIVATTALPDKALQDEILVENQKREAKGLFVLRVWYWDTFQRWLNRDPGLALAYSRDVLSKMPQFDPQLSYLSVIREAFSRPALCTPIRCENNGDSLLKALEHTQQAIMSGWLRDRLSGDLITKAQQGLSGVAHPQIRSCLDEAWRSLQEARDCYTATLSKKTSWGTPVIEQRGDFLEVRDHHVASELDRLRQDACLRVNEAFRLAGLPPLPSTR